MANNLVIGENGKLCIASSSFASAGLTTSNCTIVQRIGDGGGSWKPGRSINLLTTMTEGEVYRLKMLAVADLSSVLAPPLPESSVSPTYQQSSFTGTNGTALSAYTPEVGPTFTLFDGGWQIQSNRAVNTGSTPTSTQWVALAALTGKLNVRVTAVANVISTAGIQIWLRASGVNGANCILVQIGQTTSTTQDFNIVVYNIVSGTATELVNTAGLQDNVVGTNVTVVCTLVGNSLSVSMNGTAHVTNQTIPTTQTNINYGFGGMTTTTPQDVKFESFLVENPA